MKANILIVSIITSLLPINMEKNCVRNEPDILINATIKGCYEMIMSDSSFKIENNDFQYYLLEVFLVNNSKTSVEFLTSSCTPIGNLVLDQDFITICINKCVNNQITTIRLEPSQTFSILCILRTNKILSQCIVKLGWILLTYKDVDSPFNYYEILDRCRTKGESIIWSDPIELQCYMQKAYEIKY